MEYLKHILLTALIFIPLERIFTMYPEQKVFRRAWLNDLVYWFANGQIIGLGLAVIVSGVVIASGWVVSPSVHDFVSGQPYWLQFIEAVILSDIGFYFMHRMFHAVPFLWEIHSVHHSIEELDWLAGARIHPIDQILTKGVSLMPIFVLGFSDAVFGIFMMFYAWQTVFLHSNVNIKLGPLRWVLSSPEFHRWHHSRDPEARDRNFAAQLPFLDVLFGTMHMPKGQKPTSYGIDAPMPQNYLLQLIYPFRARAISTDLNAGTNDVGTPGAGKGAL